MVYLLDNIRNLIATISAPWGLHLVYTLEDPTRDNVDLHSDVHAARKYFFIQLTRCPCVHVFALGSNSCKRRWSSQATPQRQRMQSTLLSYHQMMYAQPLTTNNRHHNDLLLSWFLQVSLSRPAPSFLTRRFVCLRQNRSEAMRQAEEVSSGEELSVPPLLSLSPVRHLCPL